MSAYGRSRQAVLTVGCCGGTGRLLWRHFPKPTDLHRTGPGGLGLAVQGSGHRRHSLTHPSGMGFDVQGPGKRAARLLLSPLGQRRNLFCERLCSRSCRIAGIGFASSVLTPGGRHPRCITRPAVLRSGLQGEHLLPQPFCCHLAPTLVDFNADRLTPNVLRGHQR